MLNVKKELDAKGITMEDYGAFLGLSSKTIHNKIYEKTPFTYPEAEKTQKLLFPHFTIQYLFSSDNNTVEWH